MKRAGSLVGLRAGRPRRPGPSSRGPARVAATLAALAALACGDGDDGPDAGAALDAAPVADGEPDPGFDAAADPAPDAAPGPTRYPAGALRSPISPAVAARLRAIRALLAGPNDDVFMKVGASGTVSHNLLYCFAGPSQPDYVVDLGGRSELEPTLAHFRGGDAAGTTPFDRPTLAAEGGRTASWAIAGDPSPLEQEIAAIDPRFAVVNYGTNDMNMGATHRAALFPFHASLSALLDELIAQGIIPIVTGLNPRGDSAAAADWVPTYNAVTRGIAEARQVPYINLHEAVVGLADLGLLDDGIHGNVYAPGGDPQPCVLSAPGLAWNYNVRNLLTLQVLDAVRRVTLAGEAAPDAAGAGIDGDGSPDAPYAIDALPFTHAADTRRSAHAELDAYPACDGGQDEGGPELLYRLDLAAPTPVRIVVLDGEGVDIDLHLLGADPDPGTCRARADRILELTLEAGRHHLSLDTYVSSDGVAQAGEYLLVVLACEPGDPDC